MGVAEIALAIGGTLALVLGLADFARTKKRRRAKRWAPTPPPDSGAADIARGMAEAQAARELEDIDEALASSTPAADLAALGRRRK
jgi:hypothetical protein